MAAQPQAFGPRLLALNLASRAWRGAWALLPGQAEALRVPLALLAQRIFGTPPRPARVDRLPAALLEHWLARHARPDAAARARLLAELRRASAPGFRVLVETTGATPGALAATQAALAAQHWPAAEVAVLAPGASPAASPHWSLRLRAGEVLEPAALLLLGLAAQRHPAARILYADECRESFGAPGPVAWMKPEFDPDLHAGLGLFGPATAYAPGLPPGPEAATDLPPEAIRHLPVPLARTAAPPTPGPLPPGALGAEAAPGWPGGRRLRWPLPDPAPLVSIIIPTRDRAALLAACAEGVLARTAYQPIELLVVDNGSTEPETLALFERLAVDPRVRILPAPGPFNYSALNNLAAAEARGEVLLLLNNDIEVIAPDWLEELVRQALRPGVGAVGARLLYADGTLQHGGVVTGIGGVADHYLPRAAGDDPGPAGSLALVREVAAVTGACLALRREHFLAVGGLDAARLTVAFNDVDLCLKLRAAGLRNLWTPFATLYHLESASRGADLSPERMRRFAGEIATMRERWGQVLDVDPFYSPNLSLEGAHAALATPPRELV